MVYYCLLKGFVIIKNNSNQLSSAANDVKLRIHVIDQPKTDLVMEKTTAISSVVNTINKFHILSDLHFVCKNNSIMIKKIIWINFLMNTIFPY